MLCLKQSFTKNVYVIIVKPVGRSKRFISSVVFPHPDLPIINPLTSLGSRGEYNVYLGFHSKRDFLLLFLYLLFV